MDKLSGLDATQVLWIAGGVAAIFVFFVVYDAFRQRRKNSPGKGRHRREVNKRRRQSRSASREIVTLVQQDEK